jgi:ribose transport system permease protein
VKATLLDILSKYTLYLILLALLVFFTISSPFFLTASNLINITRQVAIFGICAVGMTFVILTGGIDLSTGSILGMVAAISARLMVFYDIDPVLATIFSVMVGTFCGLLNGFFVNKLDLPPLITTLATMTSLRGVTMLLTDGRGIFMTTRSYSIIGQGYIGFIPIPVIIMVIAFAFGYILLEKTKFGRYVYGIGDNEEATRLSGVNVRKVRYGVYALSGFLSSIAGVVFLSRLMSAQPTAGQGYEMDIITAVILGGVSIKGGEGKISLVIVGVLIMGVLANGMIMMNINPFWQFVVRGIVLLFAVSYDKFMLNRRYRVSSS